MRADPWHCGTPSPAPHHSSRAVTQQSPSTVAEEVKASAGSAPGQAMWAGNSQGVPTPGGAAASLCSHAASQTLQPTTHPEHHWGFLLHFTDGLCQEEAAPALGSLCSTRSTLSEPPRSGGRGHISAP